MHLNFIYFSTNKISLNNNAYLRIGMNRIIKILFLLLAAPLFVACLGSADSVHNDAHEVALCSEVVEYRYRNVDSLAVVAARLSADDVSAEGRMVAMNALGYVAMMQMDYEVAERNYCHVIENARCEIERLVADVGMMTLCYRVSANREFFDYRTTALHRIKRIDEEVAMLPLGDQERFERAKVEFGVVSMCYFSNIGLQADGKIAANYLSRELEECDDIALRIYGRMMLAVLESDALKRAEEYALGLDIAINRGLEWLAANYRLLLAITLRSEQLQVHMAGGDVPAVIMRHVANIDSLSASALALAMDAANGFERYGDTYMKIEALAVAASCNIQLGQYSSSLSLLETALADVNAYYKKLYPAMQPFSLETVVYSDEAALDGVMNISECFLSIRREAACAFAGLGNKMLSDINREAYLDLLRSTRMNKQMESRIQVATDNAARLYWLLLFAVGALGVIVVLLFFMNRHRSRYDKIYSRNLKRTLVLCRRLMSSLPAELSSEDDVCSAVCRIVEEELSPLAGRLQVSLAESLQQTVECPFVYRFVLPSVGGSRSYTVYLASDIKWGSGELSVIEVALPYIAVALEEGLRIANIGDEQLRLEEQRMAHALNLAEHKRENMLKRVSVSVLGGMRPYIDRIINELRSLQGCKNSETAMRRLQYVAELTDKLDDYNVILERWIKMRRGDLNLHVERFSVRELFDIISKSKAFFDSRGIALEICESDAVVKADKALTLFMINTLVDNAGKFTPQGGRVVLDAAEGDGFVEIAVEDSGIGMSQSDIECILNNKVYDALQIGDASDELNKNKGGGFGLMNCKGIIEKYRKVGSAFSVCSLSITSEKGKGSRFAFRLPKGLLCCLLLLCGLFGSSDVRANDILGSVRAYADSVYLSNVNGRYDSAYHYAAKVLDGLNTFYKKNVEGFDTLSLASGSAAELSWWRDELFSRDLDEDIFFNILDVRNELAVAALASQRWQDYRYNNNIYASLYRLVHEDRGLEMHYEQMQQVANYRQATVAIVLFLIVLILIVYMVSYVRYGVIERVNNRLVLGLNDRLLSVTSGEERLPVTELAGRVAGEIYAALGSAMCIERVSLLLKYNDSESIVHASDESGLYATIYMHSVCDSGEPFVSDKGMLYVLPLYVTIQGEKVVIGAMEFASERPLDENEVVNLELVVRYAASVVYHSMVRMAEHYRGLAMMEEEAERVKFEENRLHVQNMVMDNCLSVIKHETIYYPGRIRNLVQQAMATLESGDGVARVAEMRELMDYYSSIFATLSMCAVKQLDEIGFRRQVVELADTFERMQAFVAKKAKKQFLSLQLEYEPTPLQVRGDSDIILFLFESLFESLVKVPQGGVLLLRAVDCGDLVRIELTDTRRHLPLEELQDVFVPSNRNIAGEGLTGMEYLLVREIIRLHEDCMQQHGLRVEARDSERGTVIMFTLIKK